MRRVRDGRGLSRRLACAALLALTLLPASCAGGEDEPGAAAPVAGGFNQEQPGRQLRCSDWNDAGPSERRAIVDRLEAFVGGPVLTEEGQAGSGSVLEDEQAHGLFNSRCGQFPGFLLYKLYSHAAAFAGSPAE